ncbi:MAG: AAC(3) family N-acetyltransferase [Anaeroplasmataceae bacterium]|nr:AAC(3) family N-acetyltransferase [Anaeroplasmataceae bacterium]
MLGKKVKVIVDRAIHSAHPTHPKIVYGVNYGYIDGVYSLADHEGLDAYILGVDQPIKTFEGTVIAILHRENDEDKLIVSNQSFSKKEIYEKTYFMEQYFNSYIEMLYTTKEDILFDLEKNNFSKDDIVMIHSSLKSFGNVEGQDIVAAFMDYFNDGLVIFPTHTWATIQEDQQVFVAEKTPSCVGALTNIALQTNGFKRSLHPTHSVCAYGKNKEEYLNFDLNSSTPVSPSGCFGKLKDLHAKILFMGAPLSKNTFIHSIEEEMKVEDRFTEKIYQFQSEGYGKSLTYRMPRHFSTKNAHLSEHYAKLLPHLLKKNIAKKTHIGNSLTYVIDANLCYLYVKKLLEKNIHIFDDYEDYED